jgi:hypothetical protein
MTPPPTTTTSLVRVMMRPPTGAVIEAFLGDASSGYFAPSYSSVLLMPRWKER